MPVTELDLERRWENSSHPSSISKQARHGSYVPPSVGTYLRLIRLNRNLNQGDIAEALGLKPKNTPGVSDIENGIRPVDRGLAERITLRFGLDSFDRSQLLVASRLLPTEDEIAAITAETQALLNSWGVPLYLLDFGERPLVYNETAERLFGLSDKQKRIRAERPNFLELMFDPSWGLREKLEPSWPEIAREVVEAYFLDHIRFGTYGYRWHELLVFRLAEMEEFAPLWRETQDDGWTAVSKKYTLQVHGPQTISIRTDDSIQSFRAIYSSVPNDARFFLATYIPQSPLA